MVERHDEWELKFKRVIRVDKNLEYEVYVKLKSGIETELVIKKNYVHPSNYSRYIEQITFYNIDEAKILFEELIDLRKKIAKEVVKYENR